MPTKRSTRTAATFGRYLVLQLPGYVLAAAVLSLLVHYEQISQPVAYGLFALWVVAEIAMFPVMRVAYEPGKTHTGSEAMIGAVGVADGDLDPHGYVRVGAERWQAESGNESIESGSAICVHDVRGLTLVVERWSERGASDGLNDPPGG